MEVWILNIEVWMSIIEVWILKTKYSASTPENTYNVQIKAMGLNIFVRAGPKVELFMTETEL